MDTKFSPHYWGHREVEPAPPEIKLAGAWMRTNSRVTLFGYVDVTPQRFAFETGLPAETLARACQALPDWFIALPKGYFMPDFIREQVGSGESLLCNNLCKPLLRALVALNDGEVSALVTKYYPELENVLNEAISTKPLASPHGGPEKRREERSRAEQSRTEKRSEGDRGVGKEGSRAGRHGPAKAGGVLPGEQPPDIGGRMLAVAALKGRQASTPWTAKEFEAFTAARLDSCGADDFTSQLDVMRTYYAAKISRETDFRRRELLTLLVNWPGELDKARLHNREHNDGYTKI